MGSKIRQDIAKSAEGYPLLGNCIYWSFSESKLAYAAYKALLAECDITDEIAPTTKKKTAVIKAVEFIVQEEHKAGLKTKFRRKSLDNDEVMVLVIYSEMKLSSSLDAPSISYESKIILTKGENPKVVVESQDPTLKPRIDALVAEYEESYTTDQIRASVLRYMESKCGSVMVRDNGGLYFIPSTKMVEFGKLSNLFDKLSAISPCSVGRIPVIDTEDAARTMWAAVTSEIERELNDIDEELDERTASQKAFSQDSKNRRLEKIQELSTKVDMYSVLLNGKAKTLNTRISDIQGKFLSSLTKK